MKSLQQMFNWLFTLTQMPKKIVTLYLDDTSVRLLVTQGRRIKKWADLPLEPGLIADAVTLKEAEVAARVRRLFESNRVKKKKVIIGLSGLLCLTRPITLPRLPKAMLDEAVMREAKRVLPLPVEQLYISWQTVAGSAEKTEVFLVAVRRRSADSLLKMLRQAGLKPYLMDLKPLALARAVKETTAIIVDMQPTEFDIVIMADGVPQPIRTIPFANPALPAKEKLSVIKDELDRTIRFYNSNNLGKPLVQSTPMFVSGGLAEEPELRLSLENELGYPVLPLASPLKCPEQFDRSRYLVNIGLALKASSSSNGAGASAANANLLPPAYQPKPLSLTRVFGLTSAVAAAGLIIFLATFLQNAAANIASMRSQLNITNQLLKEKQLQKPELTKSIADLEKKLTQTQASRNTFTAALDTLARRGNEVNTNLEVAITTLPSTLSLTSLNYTGTTLTISGKSPSEAETLTYARALDASGRFSEVIIASMKINSEGVVFTLTLKVRG